VDATAADTIRPAGLRNGVTGLTPSAAGPQAMVTDVKALIGAIQPASRIALLVNPVQAASLASVYVAEAFAVMAASSVPAGTVIALDLDSYVHASAVPLFVLSHEVAIHEEDTAPLPIGSPGAPATVAAPTRSVWQTNSIAIRSITPINWALRRAGSVSWLEGASW
jgi:hypothetical protein